MILVQCFPIIDASQYKLRDPVLHETHNGLDTDEDEGDQAKSAMGRCKVRMVSFVYLWSSWSVVEWYLHIDQVVSTNDHKPSYQ